MYIFSCNINYTKNKNTQKLTKQNERARSKKKKKKIIDDVHMQHSCSSLKRGASLFLFFVVILSLVRLLPSE